MTRRIPTIEQLKAENFEQLFDAAANVRAKDAASKLTSVPEHDLVKKSVLVREKVFRPGFVYGFLKRFIDVGFSAAALLIFAPLWILIIILIRLDSKGRAIFFHERVGLNGKTFRLYKFRTMHETVGAQEYAPTAPNDARVTRIGKFLRHGSVDEVPQFWNVLKGDMSLVGPRPEMTFIVEKYNELQKKRLLVKPGLTGLWQIYGRKDLPLHENAEYDYWYILHRSAALDLLILLKTVTVVITGKGAY